MPIIQNKIISIVWFPWSWKTFLATFLALWYPQDRIFANIDIFHEWKRISKRIHDIDDLDLVTYDDRKWLLILDEMGINANSRRSMTDANLKFWETAMLWRKKNVDILNCAQLNGMADKYFRDLSTYTFEMDSYFESANYLMFKAKILNRAGRIIKSMKFDLFQLEKLAWLTYNTLESSRIQK